MNLKTFYCSIFLFPHSVLCTILTRFKTIEDAYDRNKSDIDKVTLALIKVDAFYKDFFEALCEKSETSTLSNSPEHSYDQLIDLSLHDITIRHFQESKDTTFSFIFTKTLNELFLYHLSQFNNLCLIQNDNTDNLKILKSQYQQSKSGLINRFKQIKNEGLKYVSFVSKERTNDLDDTKQSSNPKKIIPLNFAIKKGGMRNKRSRILILKLEDVIDEKSKIDENIFINNRSKDTFLAINRPLVSFENALMSIQSNKSGNYEQTTNLYYSPVFLYPIFLLWGIAFVIFLKRRLRI